MKLLNYRIGFASNSSSLHSTWHVEDVREIKDDIESMNFGWDYFVCSSRSSIKRYLASQYISNLNASSITGDIIIALVQKYFPEISKDEYVVQNSNGEDIIVADIDHQSLIHLPHDYCSSISLLPSIELLRDIEEYLIRTNGIVIGGNDNENDFELADIIPLNQKRYRDFYLQQLAKHDGDEVNDTICYKDNKVWKIFNRKTGEKIRFSFEDNVKYDKSDTPELVDLIITDNCNMGCPYCYRNCTPNGNHAELIEVQKMINYLMSPKLHVFEVAIGGGDILQYPYLVLLCHYLSTTECKSKITFNTTLNCRSFNHENLDKIRLIFNTFSGIAISIRNWDDINNVLRFLQDEIIVYKVDNISFQCIPELMSYEEIIEIIKNISHMYIKRITFLGFKHTGRGNSPQFSAAEFEENKKSFRKAVDELRHRNRYIRTFGVDTELLKNFPELKETQADWAYTEEEGKFSCCVDAVNGYVLPSSYSEYKEEYKIPIDDIYNYNFGNFILNTFKKF